MSSKQEKEEEVELPCMNGDVGRDDDNSGVEEGGGGEGEGEFASAMAQLALEGVRALHAWVEAEWGPVLQSACQTAAARALWGHVVRDPVAGERYLSGLHDKMRRDERAGAREVPGVSARGFVRVKLRGRGRNFSSPKILGVNIRSYWRGFFSYLSKKPGL